MTSDKVTSIRPDLPGPSGLDPFDALYDRMQERLDDLQCVLSTIEGTDWEANPELSAAVGLFRRTHQALDELHDDFQGWHMKQAQP